VDPGLGIWVSSLQADYNHRIMGQNTALTIERIAELDDVGFEWNVQNTQIFSGDDHINVSSSREVDHHHQLLQQQQQKDEQDIQLLKYRREKFFQSRPHLQQVDPWNQNTSGRIPTIIG